MKNKIFLLMFIILSVFSLSACSCQKSTYPPEDCLCIEFESQYKLDADIKFNISVGLQNGYQEKFGNIEGSKYIIAYSKNENIANNTEIKNLLIINDFSSDMYCYTKNKDKINDSTIEYIFLVQTRSFLMTVICSISVCIIQLRRKIRTKKILVFQLNIK